MNGINGGPAFPVDTRSTGDDARGEFGHQTSAHTWQFPGMTLRDYFAAKALTGFCAGGTHGDPLPIIAGLAYDMADAMLKAREVQP